MNTKIKKQIIELKKNILLIEENLKNLNHNLKNIEEEFPSFSVVGFLKKGEVCILKDSKTLAGSISCEECSYYGGEDDGSIECGYITRPRVNKSSIIDRGHGVVCKNCLCKYEKEYVFCPHCGSKFENKEKQGCDLSESGNIIKITDKEERVENK